MTKGSKLIGIAVVRFAAGVGFTVVEQYQYREDNLARLRSNQDLVEIREGVFCMKHAVESEFSTEQLLSDGFCNMHFSRLISWL
jgi:hypothetical protein